MKTSPLAAIVALCLTSGSMMANPEVASDTRFIDNGKIKIGVDLTSGGSIFWLSELPEDRNLLNHADRGRFIQQSYYGKSDGSLWVKKPWRWNPVQGGDYKGKPAKVLESKVENDELYVRSVPVNWAGGQDLEDCRMQQWIRLEGPMVKIRYRFVYRGDIQHPAVHQELPAVFIDYALPDLVYYDGAEPWTGKPFKKDQPGWPNESRKTTENWAGFVGPDGRGVGVFFPGTDRITTYRHPGPPGPKGGGCSYFAPIRTMAIEPGTDFSYQIHLTIGSAEEMRARFAKVREADEAAKK
ncbi:MAG: hypothetical protein MUF31_06805 [Akkermansiaceae bacterium]|jgi:hypothetical protein|nr:hypothetical protein [Akkermansiaceae bacterium]